MLASSFNFWSFPFFWLSFWIVYYVNLFGVEGIIKWLWTFIYLVLSVSFLEIWEKVDNNDVSLFSISSSSSTSTSSSSNLSDPFSSGDSFLSLCLWCCLYSGSSNSSIVHCTPLLRFALLTAFSSAASSLVLAIDTRSGGSTSVRCNNRAAELKLQQWFN